MAIGLDLPFQNTFSDPKTREDENNKKKKRTSIYEDYKRLEGYYKKAKQVVNLFRNSPFFWTIIIIVGVIILALISDSGTATGLGGGSDDDQDNPTTGEPLTPPIPGFTLSLEGPEVSENGVDLIYTVSFSHDPSTAPPLDQIELFDSLPSGASLVSTTGDLKEQGASPNVWALSEPQNQSAFSITVRPNVIDSFFTYTISARRLGGLTGGQSGSIEGFEQLVAGQGRQVDILGNKESFITTVIQNGQGLSDFGTKRTFLETIYDTALRHNVNPVAILSIWGVENGFSQNSILGCGIYSSNPPSSFTEGVECAGRTLDFWMADFESKYNGSPVNIPSTTGVACNYTDAFTYAYEWYTPVCHVDDSNSGAIELFSEFYSIFMGI